MTSCHPKEHDLQLFVDALRLHCGDESLIKGWEADRRICVGRHRAGLRAAARDVRQKAFKQEHIASGTASGPRAFSRQELSYVEALQKLHEELAKAQESDFDSMLRDGLEWLQERLCLKGQTLKCVTADAYDRLGEELLKKLKDQRASGHRGLAIERDLRHATYLHGRVCQAWEEMSDTTASQLPYLKLVEELVDELAARGEPDFDGKLRQAINFLENGGRRLCY